MSCKKDFMAQLNSVFTSLKEKKGTKRTNQQDRSLKPPKKSAAPEHPLPQTLKPSDDDRTEGDNF